MKKQYFEILMFEPVAWKFAVQAATDKEAFAIAKERQAKVYEQISKLTDRTQHTGEEQWYLIVDKDENETEVPYDFDETVNEPPDGSDMDSADITST